MKRLVSIIVLTLMAGAATAQEQQTACHYIRLMTAPAERAPLGGVAYFYTSPAMHDDGPTCNDHCEAASQRQDKGGVLEGETPMKPVTAPDHLYEYCLLATDAELKANQQTIMTGGKLQETDSFTVLFHRDRALP